MYVKKKLASYTRLRDEAGEQGAAARQLDDYLQVLLEAQRTQAKPALKAALSAFHRVAPLAAADPFLLSLLCVAVPLPSAAVAKKVLTNACTIATPDASVATVQCLLRRVGGDGDMCGACTELLLGLIERGLGGTAADVKKGLRLLKAVEDALLFSAAEHSFAAMAQQPAPMNVESVLSVFTNLEKVNSIVGGVRGSEG